jgi:hypothetical protein
MNLKRKKYLYIFFVIIELVMSYNITTILERSCV